MGDLVSHSLASMANIVLPCSMLSARYKLLHPDAFPAIIWTDRVRKEILHRVKAERNIEHTVKRKMANCIGHSWRGNCLLKYVIEGKM